MSNKDKKYKIVVLGCFFTGIVSVMVMVGWVLNVPVLKSILPNWATMKFSTALCFLVSAITVYLVAQITRNRIVFAQTFLPLTCLVLVMIMGTMLVSTSFNIKSGIEDLFVEEIPGAVFTEIPGQPSIGTMINFIVIALVALLSMGSSNNLRFFMFFGGIIIVCIGCIALLGYLLSEPYLYFVIEGFSTGMALHTAILFIILGSSLGLLRGSSENVNEA